MIFCVQKKTLYRQGNRTGSKGGQVCSLCPQGNGTDSCLCHGRATVWAADDTGQ